MTPHPTACPPSSPSGPPATRPPPPCWSTATTTCSPSTRWAGWAQPPRSNRSIAGRPDPGPRRRRRQGPGAVPRARGAARTWPRPGRPPRRSTSSCWSRGRRSRARRTSPSCCSGHADRLGCDRVVISDTRCGRGTSRPLSHRHARPGRAPARRDRPRPRPALGLLRRRRAQPGAKRWPGCWPGCTTTRARVTLPAFLRRRAPAQRRRSASCSPELPVRREEPGWPRPVKSRAATGEAGFSTLERIWARPTAEINGMWGGHTGPGTQDDHPAAKRTPSCPSGWSPTRTRPT